MKVLLCEDQNQFQFSSSFISWNIPLKISKFDMMVALRAACKKPIPLPKNMFDALHMYK